MNTHTEIMISILHGLNSSPYTVANLSRHVPERETSYSNYPQRIRYSIPNLHLQLEIEPLISQRSLSIDNVMRLFHEKEYEALDKGIYLSENYNDLICKNGSLLLIAHSLGTEVAVSILSNLRPDIECQFIVLGGVASCLDIECFV